MNWLINQLLERRKLQLENNIIQTPIIHEVEQSFLDYSVSVITDRAIPSAEDGLKPVARRILYDMFDKGYAYNKKFVKCAQPVGDTMGRFHPHGDSSIYGALCILSQPWTMRYPPIAFHGNNGSRDGAQEAAYRYTECKLSPIGEEMLADIKKDTVDWQLAYTDIEDEPVYLPGRIPHLIVNGTTGIAVAMACSFAPHNLTEIMDAIICALDKPDCSIDDLLQYVKGPDFPTGATLINKDELRNAYMTGKGRARVRADYIVESKNGYDTIVFTSMPYKVSKDDLIIEVDKLCEAGKLDGIVAVRDESNKDGVRFVIELAKGIAINPIINKLYKLTRLEDTYSFNQVALVNKKPKLLNLKELIEIYIDHQKDVLLRKTKYDSDKIASKIHVLEGLLIALEDIDNVIKLIKQSESSAAAKTSLMEKYNLSEAQAKAILDMKLARLAKLEKVQINTDKEELVAEFNRLALILKDPTDELRKIFTEIKNKYGDERRTVITQIEATPKEEEEIAEVEPEKCVVVMTEGGTIKRIPTTSFRTQKKNGKGIKSQDDITSCVLRTNTIDSLMIFSNKGLMYRLLVNDIPVGTNTSQGLSIRALVNMMPDEEPATMYSIYRDTDAKFVLFVSKNGLVKKTPLEEYVKTKKKTGIAAVSIKEGDKLALVSLIKDEELLLITKKGNVIRFNSNEIGPTSRASFGVKGIGLNEGDEIVSALPIRHNTDTLAIFTESGSGKKVSLTEFPAQKRAGKGIAGYKASNVSGNIVGATLVADEDNVLIVGDKSTICVSAKDIPLQSRLSVGNQLIRNSRIKSITKV